MKVRYLHLFLRLEPACKKQCENMQVIKLVEYRILNCAQNFCCAGWRGSYMYMACLISCKHGFTLGCAYTYNSCKNYFTDHIIYWHICTWFLAVTLISEQQSSRDAIEGGRRWFLHFFRGLLIFLKQNLQSLDIKIQIKPNHTKARFVFFFLNS